MFVDPSAASQHISPDTLPDQWPETSPLLDVITHKPRLVLLGDPGSGKSTLISWIVWSLAHESENQWKRALQHRMPIVMVLRELALDRVRTWDDLLAAYYQHWTARLLGRPRYASHVRDLLENGRAMIMLDGIDEVGNPLVQACLRQAVWEDMRRYDRCVWLLTSRLIGYLNFHDDPDAEEPDSEGRIESDSAVLRYIAPFSNAQVEKFAQNWFVTLTNPPSEQVRRWAASSKPSMPIRIRSA